jgi:DNA-binding transcriptional MerR regulator
MRIGEAADAVGVNPKTIRYLDIGLLPDPERTLAGYRDYTTVDVNRLVFVKTARRLGFTLAEVGEILAFREQGERPCTYVLGVLERQVGDLDRRITEVKDLRAELVALKAQADRLPCDGTGYCTVIDHATAMAATAKES